MLSPGRRVADIFSEMKASRFAISMLWSLLGQLHRVTLDRRVRAALEGVRFFGTLDDVNIRLCLAGFIPGVGDFHRLESARRFFVIGVDAKIEDQRRVLLSLGKAHLRLLRARGNV